jgi:hypothetical protein
VSVTQGVGQQGVGATASVPSSAVPCDGRWRSLDVRADPDGRFRRGAAEVDAFLTVHDPLSFDPVAQAQASGPVRIG